MPYLYICDKCGKQMVSMCEFKEHWSNIYCNSCFEEIESGRHNIDRPLTPISANKPATKEDTGEIKKKRNRKLEEYLKKCREELEKNNIIFDNASNRKSGTCHICKGDGGINGQCWKCGGSGWV